MDPLPQAFGPPPASGRIRVADEDFEVEELLGFDADGRGGHVLLEVEKRGANTGWVAGELARVAGVPVREVGYAGHKDRHALTRQSYSVPLVAGATAERWRGFTGEGYRVLDVRPHGRKLRIGAHRGNRFRLRIRDVDGDSALLGDRLDAIARHGVPNYIGPQRFGRDGANLTRARGWAGGGAPPRGRTDRGFALSAARAQVFNMVLAHRVGRGDWNRLLAGEAVLLDGRRSFFHAEAIDATLIERCAAFDVHPSGPLWGRGASPAAGEAGALECAVVAEEGGLAMLLESEGLAQERRSLRLPVRRFQWRLDGTMLELGFDLPRGVFATAVLHELLRDAWDAGEIADE